MSDPQADDWGGLSWSGWRAFDQAVTEDWIPATGGVYRFRSRGEPGLLYVGEGVNRRRRLRTLELHSKAHAARYYLEWPAGTKRPHRGHYAAPFLRLCRDAGCVVDVSWAIGVHADRAVRRAVEACLIRQYHDEAHGDPPWQHGGRGMPAYLARRDLGGPAGMSAREAVLEAVSAALGDVVTEDRVLLALQAHELALVHRFGVYLEARLRRELTQHGLTVDLDYDRHGDLRKLLPARLDRDDERRFRPDLIVHRRGDDTLNLLVVEWKKKAGDTMLKCLEKRIRSLVVNEDKHPSYNYQLGVLADSSNDGVRWRAFDCRGPVGEWQHVGCS